MKVTLIHPSRSRPEMALKAGTKWISSAGIEVEYILSVDLDDPLLSEYQSLFNQNLKGVIIYMSHNRSAVDAINNASRIAEGDILVVMSDDFDCPDNWAVKIIEATMGKTDWIAKTPDGIQKWIITLPIMDKVYYNRFGYIYHPDYLHMFCDTELTCVADLTGRKIDLNIPFTHNHYSTGKSAKDEVSNKADATWNQGESLFVSRARSNFGLSDTPGKISNQDYINWMKMKGVQTR